MGPDIDVSGPGGRLRGGAETRERILRCMIDMIERGLGEEIQLRDVAREAGVSAALIIRYFGSKSDLLFESLTTRIFEKSNPQMAAKDSRGGFKTLDDFGKFVFAADLESRYRTVSLLEMTWRLRPEQEERFNEATALRQSILRRLLRAKAPKATDSALDAVVVLIRAAYAETVRQALIHEWTPAQALERYKPIRDKIVAALSAGAFD